jgi:hypothetical protein
VQHDDLAALGSDHPDGDQGDDHADQREHDSTEHRLNLLQGTFS